MNYLIILTGMFVIGLAGLPAQNLVAGGADPAAIAVVRLLLTSLTFSAATLAVAVGIRRKSGRWPTFNAEFGRALVFGAVSACCTTGFTTFALSQSSNGVVLGIIFGASVIVAAALTPKASRPPFKMMIAASVTLTGLVVALTLSRFGGGNLQQPLTAASAMAAGLAQGVTYRLLSPSDTTVGALFEFGAGFAIGAATLAAGILVFAPDSLFEGIGKEEVTAHDIGWMAMLVTLTVIGFSLVKFWGATASTFAKSMAAAAEPVAGVLADTLMAKSLDMITVGIIIAIIGVTVCYRIAEQRMLPAEG